MIELQITTDEAIQLYNLLELIKAARIASDSYIKSSLVQSVLRPNPCIDRVADRLAGEIDNMQQAGSLKWERLPKVEQINQEGGGNV